MASAAVVESATPSVADNSGATAKQKKNVIGYYTNWSQYRTKDDGIHRFLPESVDATLLTHIVYAFVKVEVTAKGLYNLALSEWNDKEMIQRLHAHARKQNPDVKILVAVGGWTFNSKAETKHIFSSLAAAPQTVRTAFASSAVQFCREHSFDGLDVDWEYPGVAEQGGRACDKANFVALLTDLTAAFDKEDRSASKAAKLLLTIAVGATAAVTASSYDVAKLHPVVDWVGLMTYDLHGDMHSTTCCHMPWRCVGKGKGDSIVTTMKAWAEAPTHKLVLGIALYGRCWTLAADDAEGVAAPRGFGTPVAGPGLAGPYTQEPGCLAAYEVGQQLIKSSSSAVFDDVTLSCYGCWGGDQWASFETHHSVSCKVEAACKTYPELGGFMVWSLDHDGQPAAVVTSVAGATDDSLNGPYPLLAALTLALQSATKAAS